MLVISAAVPGQSTQVFGFARFTRLSKLKLSAKLRLEPSVIAKLLCDSTLSTLREIGTSSRFRQTLPTTPRRPTPWNGVDR